jgi:hypothetical protein
MPSAEAMFGKGLLRLFPALVGFSRSAANAQALRRSGLRSHCQGLVTTTTPDNGELKRNGRHGSVSQTTLLRWKDIRMRFDQFDRLPKQENKSSVPGCLWAQKDKKAGEGDRWTDDKKTGLSLKLFHSYNFWLRTEYRARARNDFRSRYCRVQASKHS